MEIVRNVLCIFRWLNRWHEDCQKCFCEPIDNRWPNWTIFQLDAQDKRQPQHKTRSELDIRPSSRTWTRMMVVDEAEDLSKNILVYYQYVNYWMVFTCKISHIMVIIIFNESRRKMWFVVVIDDITIELNNIGFTINFVYNDHN